MKPLVKRLLTQVAAVAALLVAPAVPAQVPPSATEAAAYQGLHAAAHRGDLAAIQKLASDKAALQARDRAGRTPLHVASFARQHLAVQALLQAGADPSALEQGRYDGTALIAAAHLGHDGVVRQLIKAGAPLDHVNNLHWTAVIEAIVLGDGGPRHQATLKALLDAGASTQLTDRSGATPLQLARARGYGTMVQMLQAAGAR